MLKKAIRSVNDCCSINQTENKFVLQLVLLNSILNDSFLEVLWEVVEYVVFKVLVNHSVQTKDQNSILNM